jgi:hypothetical protein
MKRILLLCFSAASLTAYAQNPELDKTNGFQKIKLGSDVSLYSESIIYKDKLSSDPNQFFWVYNNKEAVAEDCKGGTKIHLTGNQKDNKVMGIYVKIDCPDLIQMLTNKYGKPAFDGVTYTWKTEKVMLTAKANPKNSPREHYYDLNFTDLKLLAVYKAKKKGNF